MKSHWQTLTLSSETPRPETLWAGLELLAGLRNGRAFGWLALAGALLFLIATLTLPLVPKVPGLVSFLLATGIGIGLLRHVRRQLAFRQQALREGIVVEGSVTRHLRRFDPFSSRSAMAIGAVFVLPERQQTAEGLLWRREALKDLPLGTRVLGLWLPETQRIWLPLEAGLRPDAVPLELGEVQLDDGPADD